VSPDASRFTRPLARRDDRSTDEFKSGNASYSPRRVWEYFFISDGAARFVLRDDRRDSRRTRR